MKKKEIAFRPYDPRIDENFVYDSFINSFLKSHFSGVIPRPLARDTYREVLNVLIARGARIIMAFCPELDPPYDLYGWIMVEDGLDTDGYDCVHYINVKEPFRRNGIAKMLLREAGVDPAFFYYTFRTQRWRHFSGGVFKPQFVWHKKPAPRKKKHEQKQDRASASDVPDAGEVPARVSQQHRRDDAGTPVVSPPPRRKPRLRGRVLPYKRRELAKIRALGGSRTALANPAVPASADREAEDER